MRVLIFGALIAWVIGADVGRAGGAAPPFDDGSCRNACFIRKSRSYQRCRAVPPRDRQARERCFRAADAALERCLGACPK